MKRPTPEDQDPQFWDAVLRRLDPDAQQLAAAEQALAEAPGAGLPPGWVEDVVARVRPPRRRWLRLAGWAAAALLLCGLGGFQLVRLLWPARARSRVTMSYPVAFELLLRDDNSAPLDSRRSAMAYTHGLLRHCLDVLRRIRDGQEPVELAQDAHGHLFGLRRTFTLEPPPEPAPVDELLDQRVRIALDRDLPAAVRRTAMAGIRDLAGSGILALRRMPGLPPHVRRDQAVLLDHLARELGR